MYVHASVCIMYVCIFCKYIKAYFELYGCACMSMSHLKECLVDDSYCCVCCGLTSGNLKY